MEATPRTQVLLMVVGVAVLAALLVGLGADASSGGVVGRARPGTGCTCHAFTPSPSVSVTLGGLPAAYVPGQAYQIWVNISGGPAPGPGPAPDGGFNLEVDKGSLAALDGTVGILGLEASHLGNFGYDQRSWTLQWTTPGAGSGDVRFWLAGNSVNGNLANTGDAWNFMSPNPRILPEQVGNTPPTVTISQPGGTTDWTGGVTHRIWWNMTDAQDPPTSLTFWLNASRDNGATWVQLANGTSNPQFFDWSTPTWNSNQALVRVEVVDTGGGKGTDTNGPFTVDSSPPSVVSTTPADGEPNAPASTSLSVTFNESMSQAVTQTGFTLRRLDTMAVVAGTFSPWAGNTMTFVPSSSLVPGLGYEATVANARDDSSSGNTMATFAFAFTVADASPPVVAATATPSSQEGGGTVEVEATASDNGIVQEVRLRVWDPGNILIVDQVMPFNASRGAYVLAGSYAAVGTYTFTVNATDLKGNVGTDTGPFAILALQPPVVVTPMATPNPVEGGTPLTVTAVIDDSATGATVIAAAELQVDGGAWLPMSPDDGTWNDDVVQAVTWTDAGALSLGTHNLCVRGQDARGQWSAPDCSLFVTVQDTTPPAVQHNPVTGALAGQPISIDATVTDAYGVAAVRIRWDNGTVHNDSMAGGPLYSIALPAQPPGAICYYLYAIDVNGNDVRTADVCFTVFSSDPTPPSITNAAAAPNPQDLTLPVNVSASVDDNVVVASVTLTVRDAGNNVVFSGPMARSGTTAWHAAVYAIGSYTFNITVTDGAGNEAYAEGAFNVTDLLPPQIAAAANPSTQDLNDPVNLSATVSDSSPLVTVFAEVYDPASNLVLNETLTLSGGVYFTPAPFASDAAGTYRFVVWAVDTYGNAGNFEGFFDVQDLNPPLVSGAFAAPSPAELGALVTLQATVTDEGSIASVRVLVVGPTGSANLTAAGTGDVYTATFATSEVGTHTFTFWAQDAAGRWTRVDGAFNVTDATPPNLGPVTILPQPGEAGSPIGLSVTVSDNDAVAAALWNGTDPVGQPFSIPLVPGTPFSGSAVFRRIGTYDFVVEAWDPSGNRVSVAGTFVVGDTQFPSVTGAVAFPSSLSPGQAVNVSAQATDNGELVSVRLVLVRAGNEEFNGSMFNAGSLYFRSVSLDLIGSYAYAVWAVDAAGHSMSQTGFFAVVPLFTATASPSTVEAGHPVTLTAAFTGLDPAALVWATVTPPSGPPEDVALTRLDGGFSVQRTYTETGPYGVTVWLQEGTGVLYSADASFVVVDTTPPRADAGDAPRIVQGETATFNGTGSADDAGPIVDYAWTFVYRGGLVTLSGPAPEFRFEATGTYVVELTVRDAAGITDSAIIEVIVDPLPTRPLTLGLSEGRPRLQWNAPQGIDVAGYVVYRSEDGLHFERLTDFASTALAYLDASAAPGRSYFYYVAAVTPSDVEVHLTDVNWVTVPTQGPLEGGSPWLWLALGGVAAALIIFMAWRRLRRRPTPVEQETVEETVEPTEETDGSE